jgi:hypothetical protein
MGNSKPQADVFFKYVKEIPGISARIPTELANWHTADLFRARELFLEDEHTGSVGTGDFRTPIRAKDTDECP